MGLSKKIKLCFHCQIVEENVKIRNEFSVFQEVNLSADKYCVDLIAGVKCRLDF